MRERPRLVRWGVSTSPSRVRSRQVSERRNGCSRFPLTGRAYVRPRTRVCACVLSALPLPRIASALPAYWLAGVRHWRRGRSVPRPPSPNQPDGPTVDIPVDSSTVCASTGARSLGVCRVFVRARACVRTVRACARVVCMCMRACAHCTTLQHGSLVRRGADGHERSRSSLGYASSPAAAAVSCGRVCVRVSAIKPRKNEEGLRLASSRRVASRFTRPRGY